MKIKNVSPFGDLDLPLIGRVVAYGEEFEVSDDIGAQLVDQEANWEWVDRPTPTVPSPPIVPIPPIEPTEGGDQ